MVRNLARNLIFAVIFCLLLPLHSEVFLNRLEASYTYEYLDPIDTYGDWHSFNVTYFRQETSTFNFHLGATFHNRLIVGPTYDHSGILFFGGVTKDWSSRLYSNFSASFGTECDYLPEYRFDADLNLKLLKHKNLIATLGYAYVNYHTFYEDIIWRYGLALHIKRFVFELMFYDNLSINANSDEEIESSTMLFSVGYGMEGWQWTHLIFNFGSQAYLLYDPFLNDLYRVELDSNEITLKHRRWIKNDFGWFASLGFMQLDTYYEKYLFQFGLFWQW
ncbi:MAG: YaiO family outer membrane beta-barrel protein [Candidatus Cloacimonetes bacterium]|nr:YaiO family outer membrane beta-barrel protein [Candidatus Cloacimonadota bacterium]MCF7869299.1 YaiO family outer membrane beta-barrel protein [Candidatus Cloacimonadota bacterium]MCF7884721.1 YaiO family outer membrane beta-barrel protein [Candidatus Cloacimonadota bacterium]